MLTHNDKTVAEARELFSRLKGSPVDHWGFKDVGLPEAQMKELVLDMKRAGKTTYLEVVSLTEEEGLAGARLAVEAGFDILMGTVFFDSINRYLKDEPVKYYPFPGNVHSHPSILDGSIPDIVDHTRRMQAEGVDGFDLLAYRYTGDASALLRAVAAATHLPLVCAGSIASFDRIAEVADAGAWGFTIGSAFFEKKFVPDGSFDDNVLAVCNYLLEQET
jgi:hypothetical protein